MLKRNLKTIRISAVLLIFLSLLLIIVNANEIKIKIFNEPKVSEKQLDDSIKQLVVQSSEISNSQLKLEDKVAPHGECNSCHMTHNATGAELGIANGNANLCMSCHNPTGAASTMPFTNAMKAIPGTSGNSHAWNKLSTNATYETNLTTDAEMLLRVTNDTIVCSTCHNQHDQTYPPFLRISNSGDALCKNCHTARNIARYSDNSSNKGSHPVGISYPLLDSRFNATPSDPSILVVNSKVECTSCHDVHNSASSDGNLLRATNNDNLCTSCHTYGQHNLMGCTKCHDNHNTDKTNIYMIRSTIATPNSGNKAVVFTAETGANSFADGNATYNGVCEVCHTTTTYHRNSAAGDHTHNVGVKCVTCHPHGNNFTPAACHNCHDSSLPNEFPATGAHAAHAGPPYNFKCETCHYQYGQGGALEPSHSSGSVNVVFKPTGLARRNGLDTNTPIWDNVAKTCSDVYCHSNGVSADRGTDGTYTWGNLPFGTVSYATTPSWTTGTITTCTPCHAGTGNMTSPYTMTSPGYNTARPATGSHSTASHTDNDKSFSAYGWTNVQCFWCHNADGANPNGTNYQGTYGTQYHIDGMTRFKPIWYSSGGTFANGHSYASNGADAHCGNGKQCW